MAWLWPRTARRALTLAVGALSLVQGTAAHAAWNANPDDALLFDVRMGKYRLGDGVRGYSTPQGVCVDLADTVMALDIPLRIDKQSRRATGWAFEERRTVVIDRVAGTEQTTNQSRKVAPHDIYDTPEGWCVSTTALERWFGATFSADTANAVLTVKSDRTLPPEAAAERRARASMARPSTLFDLASLPQSRLSFAGIRPPAVDVVASLGGLRDRSSGSRIEAQYELYAAGEIGPVAYNARLSSDRRGLPATLRVQAYRTDPKGELLGPLKATIVAAGDVAGFSTPLVAVSSAGRGAMVTNRPVERTDRFDRTDLRGELPRGWDAELYRNGQLIAFAQNRTDGRYEFLDVALQYGQNRFEVVLYGPQGQVRREVRSIPVGFDSIPPRKTFYWAGINEDGRDLINLGGVPQFGRGGWRGTLGLERGLDAKTSVAALAHSLVVDGVGRQSYVEAAIRRAFGSALIEASGSVEAGGGTAMRLQAIGEVRQTRYAIETIWIDRFRSDRIASDVTGLHSLTIDHIFGQGRGSIPVSIAARLTTRSTGDDTIDVASRVSASLGRVALTGELRWRDERRRFGPDPPGVMEAGLLANARIGRVRLRGEARFRISPETRFESATLVGEWAAGQPQGSSFEEAASWRAEIGYDRGLERARVGLGYVRRFDRLALTASVEGATDGSVAAGLSVAFSLGPDPQTGGVRMTSEKLASRGTVLVRVYRDLNGNRRHDFGEPWEKDVGVTAGRVPVDRTTDGRGETVVDGLEPFQPVLIGIDASSLPDPMVQPALPGMVLVPRPGIVATIDLPLVGAGDVDGTLVRAGGGTIEGVDLELLDAEGRAVARTRSDFDGFFLFERVPYGRYTVRIAQLSAEAAKLLPSLAGRAEVGPKAPSAHLGAVAAQPAVVRAASN